MPMNIGKPLKKTVILLFSCVVMLAAAAPFGPLGALDELVPVDEGYLILSRKHELYLGAFGFMGVFLTNIGVKASIVLAIGCALAGGAAFFVLAQSGDPDSLSSMVESMIGFQLNYLLGGMPVVLLFIGMKKLRERG